MIKVSDVYECLDGICSFCEQESWDNSGLLVGDKDREVNRIAVVLDVNKSTVEKALKKGVDLIVSHHPLIFRPKKTFTAESLEYKLAVNGVSLISCHTCFDSADGGVNDVLCSLIGMSDVYKLETADVERELVRVGKISKISGEEFAQKVSEILGGKVTLADSGKTIKTVAVCTGSGGDFIPEILDAEIDAYVTGEASYHEMCDAKDNGLTVVCAGHFETEKPAMSMLEKRLSEKFEEIEFVRLDEICPFKYY